MEYYFGIAGCLKNGAAAAQLTPSIERPIQFGLGGGPSAPLSDLKTLFRNGRVCGLMPHPERAAEAILGSDDGMLLFRSIVESVGASTGTRATAGATR